MVEPEYFDAVRQRLEARLAKAQAEVEECKQALAGMDLANKLTKRSRSAHKADYGALGDAVANFVTSRTGDFTVQDVFDGLQNQKDSLNGSLNRDSITSVLRRLVEQHTIFVKKAGKGRRIGVYSKVMEGVAA